MKIWWFKIWLFKNYKNINYNSYDRYLSLLVTYVREMGQKEQCPILQCVCMCERVFLKHTNQSDVNFAEDGEQSLNLQLVKNNQL